MFGRPSLVTRIAVGKTVGFIFGLVGFLTIPYMLPGSGELVRWGFLLWYTTLGAMIAIVGVFDYNPVLDLPFPWWLRAPLLGGWMNFVLTLLVYDRIAEFAKAFVGADSVFASPFWFVAEGGIVGLVIGYAATTVGGEGPETAGR